jgi:hypothetical protein
VFHRRIIAGERFLREFGARDDPKTPGRCQEHRVLFFFLFLVVVSFLSLLLIDRSRVDGFLGFGVEWRGKEKGEG